MDCVQFVYTFDYFFLFGFETSAHDLTMIERMIVSTKYVQIFSKILDKLLTEGHINRPRFASPQFLPIDQFPQNNNRSCNYNLEWFQLLLCIDIGIILIIFQGHVLVKGHFCTFLEDSIVEFDYLLGEVMEDEEGFFEVLEFWAVFLVVFLLQPGEKLFDWDVDHSYFLVLI